MIMASYRELPGDDGPSEDGMLQRLDVDPHGLAEVEPAGRVRRAAQPALRVPVEQVVRTLDMWRRMKKEFYLLTSSSYRLRLPNGPDYFAVVKF